MRFEVSHTRKREKTEPQFDPGFARALARLAELHLRRPHSEEYVSEFVERACQKYEVDRRVERELSVGNLSTQIRRHGYILLPHSPGARKTTKLIELVKAEAKERLVIVVVYDKKSIERYQKELRRLSVRVIQSRDNMECPPKENTKWNEYDRLDLRDLGTREICKGCPRRHECPFPRRWTDLGTVEVLLMTEAQIQKVPERLQHILRQLHSIKGDSAALADTKPLLIFDEAVLFASDTFADAISGGEVDFARRLLLRAKQYGGLESVIDDCHAALGALVADAHTDFSGLERVRGPIQKACKQQGKSFEVFRKLFRLHAARRRALTENGIAFYTPPNLNGFDVVIAGAGLCEDLLRLDWNLPVKQVGKANWTLDPGTEVVNLQNTTGAIIHWPKQGPSLLKLAFDQVVRFTSQGLSVLLLCKKDTEEECVRELNRLAEAAGEQVRFFLRSDVEENVVHKEECDYKPDPLKVPILHYGSRGTNAFEHYDVALCINSYNIHTDQIRQRLEARYPGGHEQLPIPIWEEYRKMLEAHVVVQAVGRVRPYTRARIVILFQNQDMSAWFPGITAYDSRDELRGHFKLGAQGATRDELIKLRDDVMTPMIRNGFKDKEIVEELEKRALEFKAAGVGIKKTTVYNHRNKLAERDRTQPVVLGPPPVPVASFLNERSVHHFDIADKGAFKEVSNYLVGQNIQCVAMSYRGERLSAAVVIEPGNTITIDVTVNEAASSLVRDLLSRAERRYYENAKELQIALEPLGISALNKDFEDLHLISTLDFWATTIKAEDEDVIELLRPERLAREKMGEREPNPALLTLWLVPLIRNNLPPTVLSQLENIDKPVVAPLAACELGGVPIDHKLAADWYAQLNRLIEHAKRVLGHEGVNPNSSDRDICRLARRWDVHLYELDGEDFADQLARHRHVHRVLRALYVLRRYWHVLPVLDAMKDAPMARIFPTHIQNGASTGRNVCRRPNITSLPKYLRKLVVAPEGMGFVECDYSSFEILVCAYLAGESDLFEAALQGDIYMAIWQNVLEPIRKWPADLTNEDQRALGKGLMISMLYGRQARALMVVLNLDDISQARAIINTFKMKYPQVEQLRKKIAMLSGGSGFVDVKTGFRRRINQASSTRAKRKAFSTIVQGFAASIFKKAFIYIAEDLQQYPGARIILPLHDSVLVMGPESHLRDISQVVERAMKRAFTDLTGRQGSKTKTEQHGRRWHETKEDKGGPAPLQWAEELVGLLN